MVTSPELYVDDRAAGPDAPLVVIVHGAMDRSSSFGRVGLHLRDLHVVRYDRRGYGRSLDAGTGPLAAHVDDLFAVLDGRPATVFGHSFGAVVALVAAAQHPEVVRSVFAYEAPLPWRSWWPSPATEVPDDPGDEAEAFLRRAVGDRIWERLPARIRAARRAEGVALRADLASLDGDEPFDPAAVGVPVLVGCGSATTWWHERAARELVAELPDAELVVIGQAQHGAHLSHPTAVADLVRRTVAWSEDPRDRR